MTIDELFALTEEQRLERIENMLLESRDADPDILEREAGFLLDKGRREPGNWRVRMMLAWMENHRAGTHRRRAEYYAKESLERGPGDGSAHGELAQAVGIALPDWYARSHLEIVDWYKGYIQRRPDDWRAYLWLMDALIADYRLEEAQDYCDRLSKINDTFRVPHYRGLIAFQRGDRAEAMEIWERMCRDFPDEWMAWAGLGEGLVKAGQYERALECYQEARRRQTHPAFVDPLMAMAQIYELIGDYASAVETLEEELRQAEEEDAGHGTVRSVPGAERAKSAKHSREVLRGRAKSVPEALRGCPVTGAGMTSQVLVGRSAFSHFPFAGNERKTAKRERTTRGGFRFPPLDSP